MTDRILSLETDRLILRRPHRDDWSAWNTYFQSDRSRGNGGPHDLGRSWRGFAAILGHWQIHSFGMWTVTQKGDDTCVGMVGAWCPADWPENEIGWMIFSENFQGAGIASEATRAAINHAFFTLGWDTAVSYVADWNSRSKALAERLGATIDRNAAQPRPENPCLVYRHPNPRKDRA